MEARYNISEEDLSQKITNLLNGSNPSPDRVEELAKNIVFSEIPISQKREFLGTIFDHVRFQEAQEAILNLWTVAIMLADDLTSMPLRIDAARRLLDDALISDRQLNQWIHYVFRCATEIPKDLLIFVASDFRNLGKSRLSKENFRLLQKYTP